MAKRARPAAQRMEVARADQLAALASPVRMELLERIGMSGAASVSELAAAMERVPDSLYYHVKKLLAVGLLVPAGERRVGTRSEALYHLPARELEVPRRPADPEARAMTHKAVDSLLRLAGRELKRALEDDEALDEGPARTLYGRRLRARLTKAQLRELNRHLREIEALFAAADTRRARAGGSVALTLTLAPSPAQGAR